MAFTENNRNGLVYMTSEVIETRHVFTTRQGGVSTGEFAEMNLGSDRGDDPEAVRENYIRLCSLMGDGPDDCVVTRQVHGSEVRIVTLADRHRCMSAVPYEADGLVTAEKGLTIMCFTADCVPALLYDAVHGVAGAVHCGWKSSVADIIGISIEKMLQLGAHIENIKVALGPAIGRCCFETDDDVPDAIDKWLGGDTEGLFDRRADGKTMVDLRAANKRRLTQLGILPENVDISEECTFCSHDKYWSHRYTMAHGLKRGSLAAAVKVV